MRVHLLALIAIFPIVSVSAVTNSEKWIKRTDAGKAFGCEGAYNRERLIKVLDEAGWPVSEGVPQLDWEHETATIIAPSDYYESAHLTFFGLKKEGNTLFIDYGWKEIADSESDGAGTISFGSNEPGYAATLVVSYRRELEDNVVVKCRSLGKVR
jgi:hypothetical protein